MIVNQQVWYIAAEQYLLLGWSTDEWIKKMWYTYTMEHYSVLKEEWSHTICSNMNGLVILVIEIVILSEVSQTEKDKCDITYMWNLKHDTNEHIHDKDSQI